MSVHLNHGSTLFSKDVIHMSNSGLDSVAILNFMDFEALEAIFELGIQQIWNQNPSINLASIADKN